jgi:hypothetical protein
MFEDHDLYLGLKSKVKIKIMILSKNMTKIMMWHVATSERDSLVWPYHTSSI